MTAWWQWPPSRPAVAPTQSPPAGTDPRSDLVLPAVPSPDLAQRFWQALAECSAGTDSRPTDSNSVARLVWQFNAAVAGTAFTSSDQDRVAGAVMTMHKQVQDTPDLAAVLAYAHACFLESVGRSTDALRSLDDFANLHPQEATAAAQRRELRIGLLRRLDRLDAALAELRLLDQASAPNDPAARSQVHGLRAEIFLEQGLFAAAAGEMERELQAVESVTELDVRNELLANAVLRQGEYHLAAESHGVNLGRWSQWLAAHAHELPPQLRAGLRMHIGIGHFLDATATGEGGARASATLQQALDGGGLDSASQALVHCKLLELALTTSADPLQATAARTQLEQLDRTSKLPLQVRVHWQSLSAMELRMARAEQGPLVAARTRLLQLFQQWQTSQLSAPLRHSGQAVLHHAVWRNMVSELMELELVIDPSDQATERSLQHLLDLHTIGTLSRARGSQRRTLAEIRALLGERELALLYLPARLRSHLFLLTRTACEHIHLPRRSQLDPPLRDLISSLRAMGLELSTSAASALRSRAQAVADLLLPQPIRHRIRQADQLTIVGNSLLQDVSFDCLPWDEQGTLLGEATAITYLSDLSLGVHLREQHQPAKPARLLLVGQLQPDPITARELAISGRTVDALDGWLNLYGTERSELRDNVTVDRFLQQDLTRFDIVQILAHGVVHPEREFPGGLAFADRVLWPIDLHDHGLRARGLVILSACSSGRGAARPGDGSLLTNLGGAFLWRGASAVLLSDAPLALSDELTFLQLIHGHLIRDRMSPARALQFTRRALASRPERYLHGQRRIFGLGHEPWCR